MNVSLTPKLEKLVSKKVASGRYGSASEVVREALRLLEDRDQEQQARLGELRGAVAEGTRDLAAGRRTPLDQETASRVRSAGRRKVARL
ncbi:MAG: type II toxin-antitoxin system ParD family antitoxin [Acidobacteriota bacterium]